MQFRSRLRSIRFPYAQTEFVLSRPLKPVDFTSFAIDTDANDAIAIAMIVDVKVFIILPF